MSTAFEIAQIISTICAPIIPILWTKFENSRIARVEMKYTPNKKTTAQSTNNSILIKSNRSIFSRPWVVFVLILLCMAYVLPETFRTDKLTALSVYKIVMGVGFFFFILIQSSISNILDAMYKMKTADLEFLKVAYEKNSIVAKS